MNYALEVRRTRYENRYKEFATKDSLIIVGERPGPKAPEGSTHNTPFYSDFHCSAWMNSLIWTAGISEEKLWWLNSHLRDGTVEHLNLLDNASTVITLGNVAFCGVKIIVKKNVLK